MEAPWRLFLNNLLFTATKQQVQEVLEEYGVGYGVEYIHIPRKGSVIDGVKHTIAFITYEQKEQVEAAVLALHDKILDPISTYPVAAMHARSRTSGKAYPHQVWQPWPSPKGNNAGPHSGGDEKANDGGETKETKGEESKEEKQQQDTAFAQPVFAQPAGPPQPIWTHQPCPVHGQHFLPVDAWGASPVHLGCPVQYHPVGVIPAPWRQSPVSGTTSKAAAVARERVVLRAKPKPSSISSSEEEKKEKERVWYKEAEKTPPPSDTSPADATEDPYGGGLAEKLQEALGTEVVEEGSLTESPSSCKSPPKKKAKSLKKDEDKKKKGSSEPEENSTSKRSPTRRARSRRRARSKSRGRDRRRTRSRSSRGRDRRRARSSSSRGDRRRRARSTSSRKRTRSTSSRRRRRR